MPNKSDEEIRKSIKKYEESLPDSERNPNVQEDVERLIERASQPLPVKQERQQPDGDYTDTQLLSDIAKGLEEVDQEARRPTTTSAAPTLFSPFRSFSSDGGRHLAGITTRTRTSARASRSDQAPEGISAAFGRSHRS